MLTAGLAHRFTALGPDPVPGHAGSPWLNPLGGLGAQAGAQANPTQAEVELWLQSCSFWGWFSNAQF